MEPQPYDYASRTAVRPISWADFHGLCRGLALAVAPYAPELILPVGRGGYYGGTLLAHLLRIEVRPIQLSRRVRDVVQFASPQWVLEPPEWVSGRRVLIVDEICDTGETLRMVGARVAALGAAGVRSAVLYAHTWGAGVPDYIGLITDALLLNPWDREIVQDGGLILNPEYAEALALQGIAPESELLLRGTPLEPAKSRTGN